MLKRIALVLLAGIALGGCVSRSAFDRGVALYDTGRYEAALTAFNEAVGAEPSAAAYNNRGAALMRHGDVQGAVDDFTRGLALAPADADLYYNRANALTALGRYGEALADYNQAVSLTPWFAEAYYNRGTVRARMGDRDGAIADWRYAIGIERNPSARAVMRRVTGLDAAAYATDRRATGGVTVTPGAAGEPSTLAALTVAPATSATDLAARGVARALSGDAWGARDDLSRALAAESDASRRALIERVLRAVEGSR